jgi:hypothetical protein
MINKETFEEKIFQLDILPNGKKSIGYLKDEMNIKVHYYKDKPITSKLPEKCIYKVIETDLSLGKRDNKDGQARFKHAKLDNGSTIPLNMMVPDFINVNDLIQIDLIHGKYSNRISDASS